MTNEEINRAVAEGVFEFSVSKERSPYTWSVAPESHWFLFDGAPLDRLPPFATDPAADYSVLVRVRETWDTDRQCAMRDRLDLEWSRRFDAIYRGGGFALKYVRGATQYEPGDYSRAALAVLEREKKS